EGPVAPVTEILGEGADRIREIGNAFARRSTHQVRAVGALGSYAVVANHEEEVGARARIEGSITPTRSDATDLPGVRQCADILETCELDVMVDGRAGGRVGEREVAGGRVVAGHLEVRGLAGRRGQGDGSQRADGGQEEGAETRKRRERRSSTRHDRSSLQP